MIDPVLHRKRRTYTAEFKARLVREISEPGASAAEIARRHGLNHNQIFKWRRELAATPSALAPQASGFLPVRFTAVAEASSQRSVRPVAAAPAPASRPPRPGSRSRLQVLLATGHRLEFDAVDSGLLNELLDRLIAG